MTAPAPGSPRGAELASARQPLRTCVGCRRVRPQRELLRLRRTHAGVIELDLRRQRGGRGAYLCPNDACLTEALRRSRWTRVFRQAAVLPPEAMERLRALFPAGPEGGLRRHVGAAGGRGPAGERTSRAGEPVKGGW